MTTLSGEAAINWMRSHSTNVPGSCLNTVWQAYGSHSSIGPHAGQYPDAIDGWRYATKHHIGDPTPPAGVPVYFDVSPTRHDSNAAAGDVVISLGGGNVIATDVGGAGRIGVTTIAARAAQISRPYLGWTEDFLGYDVDFGALAGGNATPIVTHDTKEDEDDMNGFYVQELGGAGAKYWFSPSSGKLRKIETPEWNLLRSAEATQNAADTIDVKLPILNVSQEWLTKALTL